jgi:DNA (cytosine-5)-methyltransferase 1
MASRPIKVGTDCSGMEAPLQALKNLGLTVDHIFSCDIDKHVKTTIMENFPPKHWYPDLTTRDNTVAPKVDLYVAGFPCQPFSFCGLRQGFKDKKGRGTILFDICDYIEEQKPRVFVLENVVGILRINNGETWKKILETLKGLCGSSYEISWGQMMCKRDSAKGHLTSKI